MRSGNVKIVMAAPGKGQIFVNDEKVDGVFRFGVSGGAGEVNLVTLLLRPKRVDIEMREAEIETAIEGADSAQPG